MLHRRRPRNVPGERIVAGVFNSVEFRTGRDFTVLMERLDETIGLTTTFLLECFASSSRRQRGK
eukprot:3867568-Pyramimonas_sp.AAC.1